MNPQRCKMRWKPLKRRFASRIRNSISSASMCPALPPNSLRAIENIRSICEEHLQGRFELEIIDIYQQPHLAKEGQIIAAPTLIKALPPPLRKFIGDLSQTERILIGLDIQTKK